MKAKSTYTQKYNMGIKEQRLEFISTEQRLLIAKQKETTLLEMCEEHAKMPHSKVKYMLSQQIDKLAEELGQYNALAGNKYVTI